LHQLDDFEWINGRIRDELYLDAVGTGVDAGDAAQRGILGQAGGERVAGIVFVRFWKAFKGLMMAHRILAEVIRQHFQIERESHEGIARQWYADHGVPGLCATLFR